MERIEIGKKPISSENPTGTSIRYEPEFEELQAEIDKLVSISGGIPDWGKVVKLSEEILKEKSKDILVASYFCGGLLETEGLSGLSEGLVVFKDLVSNFWGKLFPPLKRKRGRIGAAAWLSERLEKVLERREPTEEEAEAASLCRESLEELDKLLLEYLGDDAPTMQRVIRILRRWPEPKVEEEKKEETEEAVEAEKEEAEPEKKPAPSPGAVISVGDITSDSDFHKVLRQTLGALKRLAGYAFNQNKSDPLAYRLLRQGVWMEISDLPPHQNNKTKLPYPGQIKDRLDKMLAEGRWDELLTQAESLLPERPLWLDLQRYTATALTNLGKDYIAARDTVIIELAGFLKRMRGLDNLLFATGEPFADLETKSWIQGDVLAQDQPGSAERKAEQEDKPEDTTEDFWNKINEMKSKGEINQALTLLREHLWHASSEREAFCRRLELAQFCLDSGLFEVAVPHLRFLEEKIKSFHVEAWEPSLAIPALVALYRCEQTLASRRRQANPELGKKLEEIYANICRLDPAEALSLKE